MSDKSEPFDEVQIDMDYCANTFGLFPCAASLEPLQSRTNLALWSEQIDNAYFTKLQISVGVDGGVAPDGVSSAELITDTAVSSIHRISRSFTYTAGQPYTFSMFFKAGTLSNVVMVFPAAPFTTSVRAQFDLAAGAVVGTPTGTPSGYGIQSVGGGWYRCWISKTATAGGAGAIEARLNAGGADTYTGTLQNMYWWGVQVELGATMSGYKPTTSATVTAFHGGSTKKCFNTFYTCKNIPNFKKTSLTYRFVQPRPNYPKGATVFPLLVNTSGRSATVNIAGSDPRMAALGQRGEVSATFIDTLYHDRFVDKYASERVSGAAQASGIGYDPQSQGTFWTKFKARNPNYAGRPMRVITAYLDGGVVTVLATRHFVISEMEGPDNKGNVTIKGKDILFLADNDKAVAPKQSRGQLIAGITADVGQSFTLNPATVGDEYAASGFGTVGSELVSFTRVGDVVTLTGRGLSGTVAATHAVNDTFQQSYSPRLKRIDDAIYELLATYAGINPAFIPFATWQAEIDRWAPSLKVTTDILKPTGVNELIGELAVLGISIWWDDVTQLIGLKVNRPPDTDVVKSITDFANNIAVKQEDRDADRLTEVLFNTMLIDPTKSITDSANYLRGFYLIDADAKSALAYGDTKIKEINCRWLNHGDDALAKILSRRLLNRFNKQPVRYEVELDINDDVSLTDVIDMQSFVISDDTGASRSQLMQVISREDTKNGHQFKIVTQSFAFDQRYAYITENTRQVYGSSSVAQKNRGAYFVGSSFMFSDGLGAYRFI